MAVAWQRFPKTTPRTKSLILDKVNKSVYNRGFGLKDAFMVEIDEEKVS